jgi:hypothetical protein
VPEPYYSDDLVDLHFGDCRDLPEPWPSLLVTDPPYPNNAGWFEDAITTARHLLEIDRWQEALVFWSELEQPPVPLPLVAVHIWHRSNVNGRPYEPIYHFAQDGRKRRSEVLRHPAIFAGAGPGCHEYLGHPTQKPVALMRALIAKLQPGALLDPFAGSGSTLRAAKDEGRRVVGVEREEKFCRIAADRLAQDNLFAEAA